MENIKAIQEAYNLTTTDLAKILCKKGISPEDALEILSGSVSCSPIKQGRIQSIKLSQRAMERLSKLDSREKGYTLKELVKVWGVTEPTARKHITSLCIAGAAEEWSPREKPGCKGKRPHVWGKV